MDPHRIWTIPESTFCGVGPYSIIKCRPTGSIFCREYGPSEPFYMTPAWKSLLSANAARDRMSNLMVFLYCVLLYDV